MKSKKLVPKEISIEKVLDILTAGEFDNLIGVIESQILDFKGSPYRLDSTKDKIELAKDISALANAGGGIVVIGVGTIVVEEYSYEVADRIRSFEIAMIDAKQYEDVIAQWIYPRLNLEIRWIPSTADEKKGLAYIRIPESQSNQKPFLTIGVLQEDDRELGNVVGFFQRKGDRVTHWSAGELHHALKDGLRFDDHLSEIEEMLGKILSQSKTTVPISITQEIIDKRINRAIDAVGLKDDISYVLVSYPDTDVKIQGLFESRTSEIVKLINGPPELRYGGFDLSTHEQSRIIDGEFRRSVLKPYKLLEVWKDGTIVFVTDGDEGFLCWGRYTKNHFLRINTIGLIESVYLFHLFVKGVFERGQAPDCKVWIGLYVKNISMDKKYGLPRAKPGSIDWKFNLEEEIAWTPEQNLSVSKSWEWKKGIPEKVAYEIVSELYAKFGLEHEFIPYVKEQNNEKVIDVEQIRNIR